MLPRRHFFKSILGGLSSFAIRLFALDKSAIQWWKVIRKYIFDVPDSDKDNQIFVTEYAWPADRPVIFGRNKNDTILVPILNVFYLDKKTLEHHIMNAIRAFRNSKKNEGLNCYVYSVTIAGRQDCVAIYAFPHDNKGIYTPWENSDISYDYGSFNL